MGPPTAPVEELLRGRCVIRRPGSEEGRVRQVAQDHVLREGVKKNTTRHEPQSSFASTPMQR